MLRLRVVLFLGFVAVTAGCALQGEAGRLPAAVVPVSGKLVQADGRPIANAWVVFHPKDPPGNEATATTDADGSFRLCTFGKDDGAIPGRYVVTIEPHPNAKGKGPRIPSRYATTQSSPVAVEITKEKQMELPPIQVK